MSPVDELLLYSQRTYAMSKKSFIAQFTNTALIAIVVNAQFSNKIFSPLQVPSCIRKRALGCTLHLMLLPSRVFQTEIRRVPWQIQRLYH